MDNLQTIIQGGAVGIAVALILAIVYLVKWFIKAGEKKDEIFTQVMGNHVNHNTKTLTQLNDTIKGNTRILERVERRLDK